jgi:hypothetical protein
VEWADVVPGYHVVNALRCGMFTPCGIGRGQARSAAP